MSKTLFQSTLVVSAMTLLSRVLGLLREMVFAHYFGAGPVTDAFLFAFRIPNFLRRLFAEGGFSQAFTPVFAEYRQTRSARELKELVDRVFGTLGMILLFLSALGMLAAPLLVWAFTPGFAQRPEQFALTGDLLRITFPYLFFVSLTACAGGILNSCGRFGPPAFTPVLLNVSMISATLWIAPRLEMPIMAVAWSVTVAGVLQVALQLPFLARLGLMPRPRWGWRHDGVRKVLKLMVPTLFGTSVAQINLLINTQLASFLAAGSITWISYSDRLMEFPQALLGVALGTVILPSLSKEHADASPEAFSRTLDWALRLALLIGLPASLALALLAGPMLATLFQYGKFGAYDVVMTSKSLATYSIGLLGFILVKVLAPGFYARQDTRTPVKIGIIAICANIGFNLLLVWPLAHAGLTLATSLAACVNAGLLLRGLRRDGAYRPAPGWRRFAWQLLTANLVMVGVLLWGAGDLQLWLQAGAAERALRLGGLILAGMAAYAVTLLLCGLRPRELLKH